MRKPVSAFVCTEMTPYFPGIVPKGTSVMHPDAFESKRDGFDWVDVKCPVCLLEWTKPIDKKEGT